NEGAHYLNPTLYLFLLALALAFQWRIFHSPWRAAAGTALIALFPTLMYLWGLTLTRDIAAHVFALTGLFLLLPARGKPLHPGRLMAAGAALGVTLSIRPDPGLHPLPAPLTLGLGRHPERPRLDPAGWTPALLLPRPLPLRPRI